MQVFVNVPNSRSLAMKVDGSRHTVLDLQSQLHARTGVEPLEQQLVQYYSDGGHQSVDASEIAAQTGDFKNGIDDGQFSNLPLYVLQSTSVVQIHIT